MGRCGRRWSEGLCHPAYASATSRNAAVIAYSTDYLLTGLLASQ